MQVTDPVCGMQIDSTKAVATEPGEGGTYYFCSASCHKRFLEDPARYAKKEKSCEDHGSHCG